MRAKIYNVLTPLYRVENLRKLIPMLEAQNVQWHVIYDHDTPFRLSFEQPWIHSYVCPNPETTFFLRCNHATNWMLDHYPPVEDQRYQILNDDDALENDFIDKIDLHEGEVIIPSMERGYRTPAGVIAERAHGATKLIAAPENMKIGSVGVEQIVISGRLLKDVRLPYHICGDGMMIEHCVKVYGADFAPECIVQFNRYEPGRWEPPPPEA